jgi:major membrane immunogen (membrane-anchored lipoprotein)
MKFFISLFLITIILITSCNSSDIIEEETFVQIYSELLISKEKYKGNAKSFITDRARIFKAYNVDRTQVDATLEYYNSDPQRWKVFFEKVVKKLENIQLNASPQ